MVGGLAFAGLMLVAAGDTARADLVSLRRDVQIDRPELWLGDVADLSPLPEALRSRAARLSLFRLNRSQTSIRLSDRVVTGRVRARMPALARWFPAPSDGSISVRYHPAARVEPAVGGGSTLRCIKALAPLSAGAAPAAAGFEPAECRTGGAKAFRYDAAARSVRAARAIAIGEILHRYPDYSVEAVIPGQALTLAATAGGIRVERQVEAIQGARPGQRLFVKSSDGELLSVRYGTRAR